MKATIIAFAFSCLAFSASADARVDLTAVITKDFAVSPSLNQAVEALAEVMNHE
jgi:hypothetical protein